MILPMLLIASAVPAIPHAFTQDNKSGIGQDVRGVAGDRPADARAAHDRAVRQEPRSAAAWAARAEYLLEAEDYREAVKSFERALKLDGSDIRNIIGKAEAYVGDDKWEAAVAHLEAATAARPESAYLLSDVGLFYYHYDENDEALKHFDAALKLDPKFDAAIYNRGLVYQAMGRSDRAIRDFNASLALVPGDAESLAAKGRVYSSLGDELLAIEYFDAAIEADPTLVSAYQSRAAAKRVLGDEAGATSDEARAEELSG